MSNVFIGAIKNNNELISRIDKLINSHGINFIDSRVADKWDKEANTLITEASLKVGYKEADKNYIKKVKYDNFKILEYYKKKLKKK